RAPRISFHATWPFQRSFGALGPVPQGVEAGMGLLRLGASDLLPGERVGELCLGPGDVQLAGGSVRGRGVGLPRGGNGVSSFLKMESGLRGTFRADLLGCPSLGLGLRETVRRQRGRSGTGASKREQRSSWPTSH